MNYSVFMAPQPSANPSSNTTRRRYGCPAELRHVDAIRNLSLKMLKRNGWTKDALPLDVHITTTEVEDDHVIYHAAMKSVVTKHEWSVAYRYSEFYAFKNQVEELYTCHSPKCSGSCEAVRDFLGECFPRKRLVGSTSDRVIHDRKCKLQVVLLHLLRCVLLPGSAMKCATARHALSHALFEFLGVTDDQDRRSLLQIYVDNQNQALVKRTSCGSSSTSTSSSSTPEEEESQDAVSTCDSDAVTWAYEDDSRCVICLEDFDTSDSEESSDSSSPCGCDESSSCGSTQVTLPCHHAFHRECIFEWLLFEYHCPLCRTRIGPQAVTNYCQPKGRVQWWLGEFEHDPLADVSD